MGNKQIQRYYNCNRRFREYVDRCAASDRVSVDEILRRALTREVAKYYQESEREEAGRIPAVSSTYVPMGECV